MLIGRNRVGSDGGGADAGGGVDAGFDDGGVPDGGVADGGQGSDGGDPGDAGASDAGGTLDGGTLDGGTFDGGADADGGSGDGGAGDGGQLDGGGGDGGLPDLVVSLVAPLCAEQSEVVVLELVAENQGGSPMASVAAGLTLPAGTSVQSSPGCAAVSASELSCDAGAVGAGARATFFVRVQYPGTAPGTRYYAARVAGAGVELDGGNNVIDLVTALTGIGVAPLTPELLGPMDAGICQGTNITSYTLCQPMDLARNTLGFEVDGGVRNDDNTPVAWHQSPSRRNLCLRSFGPGGGTVLWSVTTSATCVEGGQDNWVTLEPNIGAWRGCF